jgi:hypothetical protein
MDAVLNDRLLSQEYKAEKYDHDISRKRREIEDRIRKRMEDRERSLMDMVQRTRQIGSGKNRIYSKVHGNYKDHTDA